MKINFLAAADGTPLTKTFTRQEDGSIETAPYPMVGLFNSFEYDVNSLSDFYEVLKAHSQLGHCLVKGELRKKLENESRAGHTERDRPTRWYCIDYDAFEGFGSPRDLLLALGLPADTMNYIVQHSASAGITGKAGIRCHIFFLSKQFNLPERIKAWLQNTNLTNGDLAAQCTLSANGQSLRYALDVSTCQSDKLLYVATPVLNGIDDPFGENRIELVVNGDDDFVNLELPNIAPQANRDMAEKRVKELRKAAGLNTRIKAQYRTYDNEEILTNPDACQVTGVRQNSNGYIGLNLNGGDSWGYYYNEKNPAILRNFKGEPPALLKDIIPDYWEENVKHLEQTVERQKPYPMVFRDKSTDLYYNVVYDPHTDTVDAYDRVRSKKAMEDFMSLRGEYLPDPIPEWTLGFDPRTNIVKNNHTQFFNRFIPTKYMKTEYPQPGVMQIPRTIRRILWSMCGDDQATFDWTINWLAVIYQYRIKLGTAIIFSGCQGTGKGLFFEKILVPLFGRRHCLKEITNRLVDEFNAQQEELIFLAWDEAKIDKNPGLYDKIKHMVTEPHMTIRAMHVNGMPRPSFVNIMLFTNHDDPLPLVNNDRRFTVCPPQTKMLKITQGEVDIIEDELDMFAAYLQHFECNTELARTRLENQAREDMIQNAQTTIDQFFTAIKKGEWSYFTNDLRDDVARLSDSRYMTFEAAIKLWARRIDKGNTMFIRPHEAQQVYSYMVSQQDSPQKFKRTARIAKCKLSEDRCRDIDTGSTVACRTVEWTLSDEDKRQIQDLLNPGEPRLKLVDTQRDDD